MRLPFPRFAFLPLALLLALLLAAAVSFAQSPAGSPTTEPATPSTNPPAAPYLLDDDRAAERLEMVEKWLTPHVDDERVLDAMRRVPRHRFVPENYAASAYYNRPLPIGEGQTISQPFVVAKMTELLELGPTSRVLEIGTGSGYQAAILGELTENVWSIELLEGLGQRAAALLGALGYGHVHLRVGDGYLGWPDAAPFDAIIVTCAPEDVPAPLREQLAEGGRLVIPVGRRGDQDLVVVEKRNGELKRTDVFPVRFVPMVDEKGRLHGE